MSTIQEAIKQVNDQITSQGFEPSWLRYIVRDLARIVEIQQREIESLRADVEEMTRRLNHAG